MNKHTVNLPRAKKLKKLGWEKPVYWSWVKSPGDPKYHIMDVAYPDGYTNLLKAGYGLLPAPIASEILEELPKKITVEVNNHGSWVIYGNKEEVQFVADTPANALCDMWIYLKKEKLI